MKEANLIPVLSAFKNLEKDSIVTDVFGRNEGGIGILFSLVLLYF